MLEFISGAPQKILCRHSAEEIVMEWLLWVGQWKEQGDDQEDRNSERASLEASAPGTTSYTDLEPTFLSWFFLLFTLFSFWETSYIFSDGYTFE